MRKNIASGYNSDISVQPSAKKSKSSKQARLKRMMNLTQQQHVLPATARNKLTFVIRILIRKQESTPHVEATEVKSSYAFSAAQRIIFHAIVRKFQM